MTAYNSCHHPQAITPHTLVSPVLPALIPRDRLSLPHSSAICCWHSIFHIPFLPLYFSSFLSRVYKSPYYLFLPLLPSFPVPSLYLPGPLTIVSSCFSVRQSHFSKAVKGLLPSSTFQSSPTSRLDFVSTSDCFIFVDTWPEAPCILALYN